MLDKFKYGAFVLLLFVFATACEDDEQDSAFDVFTGEEYVSLKVGNTAIFSIDSTVYNEFSGIVKTVNLEQKEENIRKEVDAAGRMVFIIEISTRANDTLPWRFNRITRRGKTTNRLEVLDNNFLTVPLVFPILENKTWNSNVLNANNPKEFNYLSVNEPYSTNLNVYDSAVVVLQFDEENLVEKQFEQEVYAPRIGLVERRHTDIVTELNGNVRSGFEMTKTLKSFN